MSVIICHTNPVFTIRGCLIQLQQSLGVAGKDHFFLRVGNFQGVDGVDGAADQMRAAFRVELLALRQRQCQPRAPPYGGPDPAVRRQLEIN